MRAKRFLEQYREQMTKVETLKKRIDALDDLFKFTQDMTSEKVQTSPKPDRMGEIIAKKVDNTEKLQAEIREAYIIMGQVEDVIDKVHSSELRYLLQLRYISIMKWKDIEDLMGFDSNQRWVHKLHGRALNEVERILNDLPSI